MEKLTIVGGKAPLGSVEIFAAKNSVLPILACSTLCKENVVIHNCQPLADVLHMIDILRHIGCCVEWQGSSIIVNAKNISKNRIDSTMTSNIRASMFLLGPLASRLGNMSIGYPGGCNIGSRPIDIHIDGLRQLGFVVQDNEYIECVAQQLQGATIVLSKPSVGATENIMMAAVGIKDTTTIVNAAAEPEVQDLGDFINAIGGQIIGAGTSIITIKGGQELYGTEYTPIGDRIVAGSYLMSVCMGLGGDITVKGVSHMHMQSLLRLLQDKGCAINTGSDFVRVVSLGRSKSARRISTRPYPGFATDLQAQIVAVESVSRGQTTVVENIFENRFGHIQQLVNMGADITVDSNTITVRGIRHLQAKSVYASDLRSGAALVLAGIAAQGTTTVHNVGHIDRGYYKIENDFVSLGIDVSRQS